MSSSLVSSNKGLPYCRGDLTLSIVAVDYQSLESERVGNTKFMHQQVECRKRLTWNGLNEGQGTRWFERTSFADSGSQSQLSATMGTGQLLRQRIWSMENSRLTHLSLLRRHTVGFEKSYGDNALNCCLMWYEEEIRFQFDMD
ncbi:hypothetical protein C5167_005260, partial [Papaver somniferum]